MAADPKDTTVADESTKTLEEVVTTEAPVKASAAPARRLSPEELIRGFEADQLKAELPDIYVGDTVRVGVRISEGNKERAVSYTHLRAHET